MPTPFEDRVARNVRAKIAAERLTTTDISIACHLSEETVRRRARQEKPWTLADLELLAIRVDVDPEAFTRAT